MLIRKNSNFTLIHFRYVPAGIKIICIFDSSAIFFKIKTEKQMPVSKNQIRKLAALADKKHRDSEKLFVAEGEKIAAEFLTHHLEGRIEIRQLFAGSKWIKDHLDDLENARIEFIESDPEVLRKASSLSTPPGVMLTVSIPEVKTDYTLLNKDIALALEAIRDPGNLGTIIRTADWFGVRQIFCSPDSVDQYNPKCIQASMGAIARVKVIYTSLPALIKEVAAKGIPVYGTLLDGDNIYNRKSEKSGIILFGNESRGLSQELTELVQQRIRIPEYPAGDLSTESLNIATSAAIVMAEWRRA